MTTKSISEISGEVAALVGKLEAAMDAGQSSEVEAIEGQMNELLKLLRQKKQHG